MQTNEAVIVCDENNMPFANGIVANIQTFSVEIKICDALKGETWTTKAQIFKTSQVKPVVKFDVGAKVDVYDHDAIICNGVITKDNNIISDMFGPLYKEIEIKEVKETYATVIKNSNCLVILPKVGDKMAFAAYRIRPKQTPKICTCNLWTGCTCGVFKEEMKCKM